MADVKISALPAASALTGTELVPIVQGGVTVQSTVNSFLTSTVPSGTANGVLYLNGSKQVTSGSGLVFDASGNLGIGTSSPTNTLSVAGSANVTGNVTLGDATTDTVTVNGYMGVGGAPLGSVGVYSRGSALTGANQYAFRAGLTGTSAATGSIRGYYAALSTEAAAFTTGAVVGFQVDDAIKGAGSTITDQHGLYVANQTQGTNNYGITSLVSSGANKWNIYASGTAANYFAGNVLLNTTTNLSTWTAGSSARLQIAGSSTYGALSAISFGTANPIHSGAVVLGKSRGAVGALAETLSGDALGFVSFEGVNSSSASIGGAYIRATQTAAASATHIPAAMQFFTSSGTSDPTERMRIDSSGNVGIGVIPSSRLSIADINATVYTSTGATASPVGAITSIQNASNTDGGFSGIVLGANQAAGTSGNTYIGNISSTGSLTGTMVFGRRTGSATYAESMRLDSSGNLITTVNAAAPSLSTNSTMSFELTSNTSLKVVVRGTDGVTRSVSLTLA